MDFTIGKYRELLLALNAAKYSHCLRFDNNDTTAHEVLLRHDVDLRPAYSLRVAQVEAELGFQSVYYFRAVPESWDNKIILQIQSLGHEVGYHYESLTTCNGDLDSAYQDFCQNLNKLNNLLGTSVKTICMHGSPRSPFDSKDIWKKYDYHELGIDFEPYLDTDFSKTFYLTDTGRRWDGYKVSVRDKIPQYQDEWNAQGLVFHSTNNLLESLYNTTSKLLTSNLHLMITTHPQRWMPFGFGWTKELILQNAKNIVKSCIISK